MYESFELEPRIVESLSEIKSNPIRRRLTRELTDLQKMTNNNFLYVQSVQINQKGIPAVTIVDYSTENLNVYEFTTDSYPFSVPKIKVNSSNYSEFLRIKTLTFQHLLKKINRDFKNFLIGSISFHHFIRYILVLS